ncbi:MAG: GNAT family N-acetyltransferase [Pseudomonadota bacterium]
MTKQTGQDGERFVADVVTTIDKPVRAATYSFFSNDEWLQCLFDHGLNEPADLAVHTLTSDARPIARLVAVRPLEVDQLVSLTNYYSLINPGLETVPGALGDVLIDWLAAIRRTAPGGRRLVLDYLAAWDPATPQQVALLQAAGYRIDVQHKTWNWRVCVAGKTFADYWSARPSRLRNTVDRADRRLTQRRSVRLELAQSLAELDGLMSDYQAVYSRSWKPTETPAGFMPAMMRLAASGGRLRLAVLYLDDQPAAAQCWIVDQGIATIYKLAHDPVFGRESVGSVLTRRLIERAIETDKVAFIDYGVGDEPYKRDWMADRRQLVTLTAVGDAGPIAAATVLKWRLRDVLRRLGWRDYVPVQLA